MLGLQTQNSMDLIFFPIPPPNQNNVTESTLIIIVTTTAINIEYSVPVTVLEICYIHICGFDSQNHPRKWLFTLCVSCSVMSDSL